MVIRRATVAAALAAVLVGAGAMAAGQASLENGAAKSIAAEAGRGVGRQEESGLAEDKDGLAMHERERGMLEETLEQRLGTLTIHGGAVGYYQGANSVKIGDSRVRNTDGAGFAADLELSFSPLENGTVFMRVHAGEGKGADTSLEPFANLNTIGDDNPDNDGVRVLDLFYTQRFFDEKLSLSIGKAEPFVFVDDNAFANDEYTQFVGKPFVNNPVFDSEDEYAPLVALTASPMEEVSVTLLCQSSSRPRLADEERKSSYDRIFDKPLVAGQFTYSPCIGDLKGNWRLYGWAQTYPHPRLVGDDTEEGWGIGLSLDQMVHRNLGLFARAGYQNKKVYEVPWFWSAGGEIRGLLPSRGEDHMGIGVAGLKASKDLEKTGTEFHVEAYYRCELGEHLAVSPDIQYVINPLGDGRNDEIVVGTIRLEANF
jgi:hypothetical protein